VAESSHTASPSRKIKTPWSPLLDQPDLSSLPRLLYIAMCDAAGEDGMLLVPAYQSLKPLLGASRNAIRRSMIQLQQVQLISGTGDGGIGSGEVVKVALPKEDPRVGFIFATFAGDKAKIKPAGSPARAGTRQKVTVVKVGARRDKKPNAPIDKKESLDAAKAGAVEDSKRATKMTDAHLAAICVDDQSMVRYLWWGIDGMNENDPAKRKPSAMNWGVHGITAEDQKVEKWTVPQFSAYYWWMVCWVRSKVCNPPLPLSLPHSWDKLIGQIRNMRKTMSAMQLHTRIQLMCVHWHLVRKMCGSKSEIVVLSEDSLGNPIIRDKVMSIEQAIHNQTLQGIYQDARNGVLDGIPEEIPYNG